MLFRNRKLNRLQNWDYSRDGWYYVTICVGERKNVLGEITQGEMGLNIYGQIVRERWVWLGEHFENVILDEYVIMPNHVHGIVVIKNNPNVGTGRGVVPNVGTGWGVVPNVGTGWGVVPNVGTGWGVVPNVGTGWGVVPNVGTGLDLSVRSVQKINKNYSLSEIVGAFKTTSSKLIHRMGLEQFQWHRSFFDEIIRDKKSLVKIRWYIRNNPRRWNQDRNNLG